MQSKFIQVVAMHIHTHLSLYVISSCKDELSQVVSDVGAWWGVCDGVREWLREAESLLADQRPLAGSVDIVEKQRNAIQVTNMT